MGTRFPNQVDKTRELGDVQRHQAWRWAGLGKMCSDVKNLIEKIG
jgi:hypothetical protein